MDRLAGYIEALRERCNALPDKRTGSNGRYSMADIGLAAFSLFFMQCPSFLQHQRLVAERRGQSNLHTLFGLTKIPTDVHIRNMLDGTPTGHFDPNFISVVDDLERAGFLAPLRRLDGHVLIALDGSEHFCSRNINCPHCSTRKRKDGKLEVTEYFHSLVSATIVAPDCPVVLPLPPEFVRPQDGAQKQDCEPRAAYRWLARLGPSVAALRPIFLGDDLYAHQPMCQAVRAVGGDFIFGCKPDSHKTLMEYISGVELPGFSEIVGKAKAKRIHRYRWIEKVPIRDGKDAIEVNWFELEISKPSGEVTQRKSFISNLPVNRKNIVEMVACGRTRWKIENENFNVLKNNGYNFEHNFGHGSETLSSVFAALNLLAFLFHGACDLAAHLWQRARDAIAHRALFFQHLRLITVYHVFPSWSSLMWTVIKGTPPPQTS